MAANALFSCSSNAIHRSFLIPSRLTRTGNRNRDCCRRRPRDFTVYATTKGSAEPSKSGEETMPSWAKPGSDEPPPWAREGSEKDYASGGGFEAPFFVYLLASAVSAIAAIGSIFEYANQKPVFGVVSPDSIFYAPLLGLFTFAGLPLSIFLWFKSVQVANKEAEDQDRRDGFM